MITVSILINGQPIYTRTAVNVGEVKFKDGILHQYNVDDGSKIYHRQKKGAIVLAKRMLDTIKEEI